MALGPDDLAQISAMIHEALLSKAPLGRDGMVVPGSYNAQMATVDVMLADTAVIFPDDASPQQPMVERNVPLATTHIDDAYGPFGGELVHLVPTQSGYTAHLYRQPDGSEGPNAPQGERWVLLRNPAGAVISHVKITQNGASGDGLGGMDLLTGSKYKAASTGGHTMLFDDAGKIASIVSAGGIVSKMDDNLNRLTHQAGSAYALFDGAGNMITHIAGDINLGALSTAMTSANAALNQSHLTTFENSLFTKRFNDLSMFATAMVAAEVPNAGAVIGLLATLLHVPIPSGSSIVKIAS